MRFGSAHEADAGNSFTRLKHAGAFILIAGTVLVKQAGYVIYSLDYYMVTCTHSQVVKEPDYQAWGTGIDHQSTQFNFMNEIFLFSGVLEMYVLIQI